MSAVEELKYLHFNERSSERKKNESKREIGNEKETRNIRTFHSKLGVTEIKLALSSRRKIQRKNVMKRNRKKRKDDFGVMRRENRKRERGGERKN